jgi:hypothetical protein
MAVRVTPGMSLQRAAANRIITSGAGQGGLVGSYRRRTGSSEQCWKRALKVLDPAPNLNLLRANRQGSGL